MNERIKRNIEILEHELHDLKLSLEHNNEDDIKESIKDAQMTLNHIEELIEDNY